MRLTLLLLFAALLPVSCTSETPTATTPEEDAATAELRSTVLDIARNYRSWRRVDDEPHWSPTFCRMPLPSAGRMSESRDADTHGRKIYWLFAKHRMEYVGLGGEKAKPTPVGQAIVKEAWAPAPATQEDVHLAHDDEEGWIPYAKLGGRLYRADEVSGLFIMLKTDRTEGTDEGWVYATLSADGTEITALGRIGSCMECHADAPHGRLFGLQESEYPTSNPMKLERIRAR